MVPAAFFCFFLPGAAAGAGSAALGTAAGA